MHHNVRRVIVHRGDGSMVTVMLPRPATVTSPTVPSAIMSIGHSGSVQTRAYASAGRAWTETWPPLKAGEPKTEELLAQLENWSNRGLNIEVEHLLLPGSGKSPSAEMCDPATDEMCLRYYGKRIDWSTPSVVGTPSGTSITTDGWSSSADMRAGNVVRFGTLSTVHRLTENAGTPGSGGSLTLRVNPPVFSDLEDNDPVTYGRSADPMQPPDSVMVRVVVTRVNVPTAQPNEFYGGLSVEFREVPGVLG